MSQHPDGGECAHLNVEAGLATNDADAPDERPHELLPVFEARGFHKARQVVERRQTVVLTGSIQTSRTRPTCGASRSCRRRRWSTRTGSLGGGGSQAGHTRAALR